MARELTEQECRDLFLEKVRSYVEYWENESRTPDLRGKLEGLAFSMMAIIDGCADGLPGFSLTPCPHPQDKEFHQEHNENWWPESDCDIGGTLHEEIFSEKVMS
ncbi:hypothetical protein C4577_02105 [Candidatus Parcubacteria bacterium]|nr:MAG: hypothetical protein C4577_02105 [Candidatus Parcubacteria bacterium]